MHEKEGDMSTDEGEKEKEKEKKRGEQNIFEKFSSFICS